VSEPRPISSEGKRRQKIAKRLMDLSCIAFTLPVTLPIMATIAVIMCAVQGTPVFFRQQRPGLHGRPFMIYKFRTMLPPLAGSPQSDVGRLTRLGRILRSTSLDELPELFNVVKGDMSLVGPRPLLMEYLEHYTPKLQRRHDVLPGITGWAQVNGRNTTSWERRFALDIWYVDHHSLLLDIKILVLTMWKVIKREGILEPGHPLATENFKGLPSKHLH